MAAYIYTKLPTELADVFELKVALLGSYPPRECGIATFTADLVAALAQQSLQPPRVIAIDEPNASRIYGPEVAWRLEQDEPASYHELAATINACDVDVINIQHEYGLFGGDDGEMLLEFMRAAERPIVTTLHTVLPEPSGHMREVTQAICALSAQVVVLARSAIGILEQSYGIDPAKVVYIPHGIPSVPRRPGMRRAMKERLGYSGRTLLSTFGLINPDKGIEYVIRALPPLVERHPNLLYLVLGETHPGVRRASGEQYREGLQRLVDDLGLHDHVAFENRYLGLEELVNYLLATDVYLMPYLNPAQIVSGTLAYAVGCGKAVIATSFQYAQEMLADGRGIVVPFRSPGAITEALQLLLDNPIAKAEMEARAYAFSRAMEWPSVAAAYQEVFVQLWAAVAQSTAPVPIALARSA